MRSIEVYDVYANASAFAGGGYVVGFDQLAHRTWTNVEMQCSSTFRELLAIQTVLLQLSDFLKNRSFRMYTDNKNAEAILKKGSTKPHLQSLATEIHSFLFERSMTIFPVWLPRDQNVLADQISKFESLDAWEVSFDIFAFFDMRWGPHDFDLFASHSNAKCKKFYSKEPCTGSSGTNAFRFNWAGNNNWIAPSISLFAKAINHARACRSNGTLIIPEWKSTGYWPLLMEDRGLLKDFVENHFLYQKPRNFFQIPETCSNLSYNQMWLFFNFLSISRVLISKGDFKVSIF